MEFWKFAAAVVLVILSAAPGDWVLKRIGFQGSNDLFHSLATLVGFGLVGTVYGFVFLIPGAVSLTTVVVLSVVQLFFLGLVLRDRPKLTLGTAGNNRFIALGVVIFAIISLAGVMSPSTALDWDSIAYHLAVPKLWVQQGHAGPISFIHHSNFPGAVDSWFVVGELIGGQTASKAFIWMISLVGAQAIAAFLGERFSQRTGLLGALAFVSIPMVMWESGSAYIDVANGLFAGFGFVFAAQYVEKREKTDLWVAAILLSLAAESKYTGLQAIVIASLIVLLMVDQKDRIAGVKLGAMAAAFACPWYLKNWILVGNPVYPFFYGVFGGKNWDKFQGQIYSEEQNTFGYHGAMNLGQGLFGLITSPGRFTNPQPALGNGFAFVSLGFALFVGAVIGIVRGVSAKFDKALGLMILLQLLAWFFLSQQSRYILTLAVPLLYFVGRGLEWKPLGKVVIGAIVLQALASLWVYKEGVLKERLPVLSGGLTRDEFLGGYRMEDGSQRAGAVDTYGIAKVIDADPSVQKIALYDEVFGYYLNKPYIWASPGHTTEFGYADMKTADELVASLKRLGVSHVYVTNRYIRGTEEQGLWEKAAGIDGSATPYSAKDRESRMGDERSKWRVLLAEAIASKKLTLHTKFSPTRFLFKVE